MISTTKNKFLFPLAIVLAAAVGVAGSAFFLMPRMEMNHGAERNKEIIAASRDGIKDLLAQGRYKCCLDKPCSYCFADPEHQDRELVCDCLEDIMNGKHPCGECIGEILEGNGNPLISEYFASSIAEKVGESHLQTLKQIIAEKYGMPAEKQF
ncbi:MAG: hypothetical protein GXP44_03335 [bacterium]|nr:hypothetical protein [bacterium]